MLKLEQVKIKQKDFIEMQLAQAKIFIEEIIEPNDQISTCMLSGSVARGDYWVGPKGGAIDLIIFVANLENFDTEKNYDYMTVYDKTGAEQYGGKSPKLLSGSIRSPYWSQRLIGDTSFSDIPPFAPYYIRFQSDSSITKKGFAFFYYTSIK